MPSAPRPSPPPKYTGAESEAFFRRLRDLEERIEIAEKAGEQYEVLSDELRGMREAFDSLDKHVRDMMRTDGEHGREIGELKAQAQLWAMHAGGQVGGLTGSVAGTDAARTIGKNSTALGTIIAAVIAAITSIIVLLLNYALQPVKPIPAAVTADQGTIDRVDRIERELKREQAPKP